MILRRSHSASILCVRPWGFIGLLGLLLVAAVDVDRAAAQTAVSAPPAVVARNGEGGAVSSAASANQSGAAKESDRLKKFKAIRFDRRPSVILETWAKPPKKKPDFKIVTPLQPPGPVIEPPAPIKKDQATILKEIDAELQQFGRHVSLGDWAAVKSYLKNFTAQEGEQAGKQAYQHLLLSLRSGPGAAPMNIPPGLPPESVRILQQARQQGETNSLSPDDIFGLAAAAPCPLEKDMLTSLGGVLQIALRSGDVVEGFLQRLRKEVEPKDVNDVEDSQEKKLFTRRQAAQVLFAANLAVAAGDFLPSVTQATKEKDAEALNLLSRYYLALHAKEKKTHHLEQAWSVTQAALASGDVGEEEKKQALHRAVDLAPKIRDELGQAWLEESFAGKPRRGMEILAAIGSLASKGMQMRPTDPDYRLKELELQKLAVDSLLKASPHQGEKWSMTLNLLADVWLREAEYSFRNDTSTSYGPHLQRDIYGNLFYFDASRYMSRSQRNRVRPIPIGKVLDVRPQGKWLALLDEDSRPRFSIVFAELYLKVNEEVKAFPYIETLAATHPEKTKELVKEFFRIWTEHHDPNSSRRRTNPYMFIYGFERKAESIPLTRSKQERNLKELAEWVKRLRALPIGEIDEALLAKAFTTCHSTAEVYRMEAIETVFGSFDKLKPKTLAELAQKMRTNLLSVWRQPAVQKKNQTNRKKKDIQAEVLRGYQTARVVIGKALQKHPRQWSLKLAQAALEHDENNYRQDLESSTEFVPRRREALAQFQQAAEYYAAQVNDLGEDEQTIAVYETWFYASLGACDIRAIDQEKQADRKEPVKIRAAILALPTPAANRHMDMFANTLFTRMSALNPAVKFRYLRAGFEIVGDHKQAREARKVYQYYKDLVTEIRLEAILDGSSEVGHQEPFGLFVNLRHTREIERESGGFARYLQNQNNQYYSYNYGRPTEDYRDKFQQSVQEALNEHFEVLSVTFNSEKDVHSKATSQYGWRVTPYAYLLLKARGPEIDKVPPLRLDLDFLDTSGYAIIPIETPAIPIDASGGERTARGVEKLTITQTLDEREADEGKLKLEVKATGLGLIPSLDQILELNPADFEVASTEDQGISVSKFDQESDKTAILSERIWMVEMKPRADLTQRPETFRFGKPKVEVVEAVYQRYVDADLATVDQVVALEQKYEAQNNAWIWWTALGVLGSAATVALLVAVVKRRPRRRMPGHFNSPSGSHPLPCWVC